MNIRMSVISKGPRKLFTRISTYSKLRLVSTEVRNMKQYPIEVCYNYIRRLLLMSMNKTYIADGK